MAVPPRLEAQAPPLPLPKSLRDCHHPVVIAGTLAIRQDWREALAGLSIPVFTTAAAKGVINETLPQAAGVYTGVGLELAPEASMLQTADLVVGLGLRAEEVLAFGEFPCAAVNLDVLAPACQKIPFNSHIAASQAAEVFLLLGQKEWGLDELAERRNILQERLHAGGFLPAQVLALLTAHFGQAVRLVVDTGYFCTVAEHAWLAPSAELYLGSGQGRYMGIGMPMALAASVYDPSVPTVLVTGDGGIGMYFGELKFAVEQRLPILVLLMTDGGFGSIRSRAIRDGLNQAPLCFPDRSWRPAAEGMGLFAAEATNSPQLETALRAWRPGEGPAFVEVKFDADAYQSMLEGLR
jgi:thiamine pyrophosphate-dependent acetolactate synthase large subunit-like protein